MLRICYYLGTGYGFISSNGIWIKQENVIMKPLSTYLSHLLVLWYLPHMSSFRQKQKLFVLYFCVLEKKTFLSSSLIGTFSSFPSISFFQVIFCLFVYLYLLCVLRKVVAALWTVCLCFFLIWKDIR